MLSILRVFPILLVCFYHADSMKISAEQIMELSSTSATKLSSPSELITDHKAPSLLANIPTAQPTAPPVPSFVPSKYQSLNGIVFGPMTSSTSTQYLYTIQLFESVTQQPVGTSTVYNLGQFTSYDSNTDKFAITGGTLCGSVPRSGVVSIHCDRNSNWLKVTETQVCYYEIDMYGSNLCVDSSSNSDSEAALITGIVVVVVLLVIIGVSIRCCCLYCCGCNKTNELRDVTATVGTVGQVDPNVMAALPRYNPGQGSMIQTGGQMMQPGGIQMIQAGGGQSMQSGAIPMMQPNGMMVYQGGAQMMQPNGMMVHQSGAQMMPPNGMIFHQGGAQMMPPNGGIVNQGGLQMMPLQSQASLGYNSYAVAPGAATISSDPSAPPVGTMPEKSSYTAGQPMYNPNTASSGGMPWQQMHVHSNAGGSNDIHSTAVAVYVSVGHDDIPVVAAEGVTVL